MQQVFLRWARALTLLCGVVHHCASSAQAQAKTDPVRGIRWYYLPLSAFVRYGIDSATIRAHRTLEGRVRHPAAFLHRVRRTLMPHPAASDRAFGAEQVRMRFDITYADGRTECLLVDVARTVWWRHRLYRADSAAEAVFLSVLSRQQQRQRVGKDAPRKR
jgi:hypothetical protein